LTAVDIIDAAEASKATAASGTLELADIDVWMPAAWIARHGVAHSHAPERPSWCVKCKVDAG